MMVMVRCRRERKCVANGLMLLKSTSGLFQVLFERILFKKIIAFRSFFFICLLGVCVVVIGLTDETLSFFTMLM